MYYLLVFVVFLCAGCSQNSFQNFGSKIDSALHGKPIEEKRTSIANMYSLTVQANPRDSRIKIMNIKPRYHDGIRLKSGVYDVLIEKDGYESYRENITVSQRDVVQQVQLMPLPSVAKKQQIAPPKQTQPTSPKTEVSKKQETDNSNMVKATKKQTPPTQAKLNTVAKPQENTPEPKEDISVLRADYFPPELAKQSLLTPVELDKNDMPSYDGAYLKVLNEGFFTDSFDFVEMDIKPAYTSVILETDEESISISWLIKQAKKNKKYFALDISNTISLPLEQFKGVLVKGKDNEYVSLHKVKKVVRGYDKNGRETGETVTFFDSNKHVDKGQPAYTYEKHLEVKKNKPSEDSYFYMLKGNIEKGLYVAWFGKHFCFFNLL